MSETGLDRNTFGGWSAVKPVTLEVKPLIKERVDNDSAVYIPLLYASQIVEGTNYVVKVLLNLDGLCVHVKIYQPLACDGEPPKVMEIQFPKTFDDPLTPF